MCKFVILAVTLSLLTLLPEVGMAQPLVTVAITKLLEFGGTNIDPGSDCFNGGDFYAVVTINGVTQNSFNKRIEGRRVHCGFGCGCIIPNPHEIVSQYGPNELWIFNQAVPPTGSPVNIRIEIWDDDPPDRIDLHDDIARLKFDGDEALNLVLDPNTGQVSGDVNSPQNCSSGFSDGLKRGKPVEICFEVSSVEPAATPGLAIRCLHSPIWPQPGDTVTIKAEALDGNANLKFDIVDNIEIWADDTTGADNTTAPIATSATTPGSAGLNTFQVSRKLPAGDQELLYRCRVQDKNAAGVTERVSSGWRRVQIGQPASGRAVSIIRNAPSVNNTVDIVFIPDQTSYTGGANDSNFLKDVFTIIRNEYYAGNFVAGLLFLEDQDLLNFWIALDTGNSTGFVNRKCGLIPPNNWNTAYTFADAGTIIHTAMFRDCALPGRHGLFSSDPVSAGVVLHETGHAPFGLADEYCCDGGYFQPNNFPNVYRLQMDCRNDPLALGLTTQACQEINGNACVGGPNPILACKPNPMGQDPANCGTGIPCSPTFVNRFRLDLFSTITNDLMVNNRAPQRADQRSIGGFFNICRQSQNKC